MLRSALVVTFFSLVACQSPLPADPAVGASSEAALEIRVVRLRHARVEEIEPLLVEILQGKVGQQAGDASGVATAAGKGFKVVAQATTNSLVVSGTRRQVVEAMERIASLDVPATPVRRQDPR